MKSDSTDSPKELPPYWLGQTAGLDGWMDSENYDFRGYKLTLGDKTEYHFKRVNYCGISGGGNFLRDGMPYWVNPRGPLYLDHIITPNGEKIEFQVDTTDSGNPVTTGVKHYMPADECTKSMKINRDISGRITEIYPPSEVELVNGNVTVSTGGIAYLKYFYDFNGNLKEVHKLVDKDTEEYEVITYLYADTEKGITPDEHYVTDILDPRGLSPVRYIYDNGRLVGLYDAKGEYIKIEHDTIGKIEKICDRTDTDCFNPTIYQYDDQGRVLSITKTVSGAAQTTSYFYDGYGPKYGHQYEYYSQTYENDYSEKPSVVTDNKGNRTFYQYYLSGQTRIIIDPEENLTHYGYDENGHLTLTEQWMPKDSATTDRDFDSDYDLKSRTESKYYYRDSSGQLTLEHGTAPNENTLTDLLVWTQNTVVFDNLLTTGTDETQVDRTTYVYDGQANGYRLLKVIKRFDTDPSDISDSQWDIITEYDFFPVSGSSDQPYSVSEPYYRADENPPLIPRFINYSHYDENGNLDATWYYWDDPELSGLNGVDTRILTISDYDAQARVIRTRRILDNNVDAENPDLDALLGGNDGLPLSETLYNSIGKPQMTVDQYDNTTLYEYDEVGNLVETMVFTPDATLLSISRTLYDIEGRVKVTVGPYDPSASPVGTENVYDELGRVVETRRWADVDIVVEDITVDGQVVGLKSTDWTTEGASAVAGNELSYTLTKYDDAGRVKRSIILDDEGYEQPTSYIYDAAGKQIAVIDPSGHGLVKQTDYTQSGNWYQINIDLDSITYDFSHATRTVYEGSRRKYVYDAKAYNGTVSGPYEVDDAAGTHYYNYRTELEYDGLGRVVKTTYPPTSFEGSSGDQPTYTHVGYDGLGRKKWQSEQTATDLPLPDDPSYDTIPAGINKREFEYDAAGRLTQVKLPEVPIDGGTAQPTYNYFYDDNGNLVGSLDAEGRLTAFKYDHLGNQVAKYMPFTPAGALSDAASVYSELSQATPAPDVETKQYDALGRLEKAKDYKGHVTGFQYNDLGQLQYKKYYIDEAAYISDNAAETVEYTYDNLGRKDEVIVDAVTEQDFDYDVEGRIESVATDEGIVSYQYDPITGQKSTTSTDNTQTNYSYDKLGRLAETKLMRRDGTLLTTPEVTSYTYTAVGSRESVLYPNGNHSYYVYNAVNRLSILTNFQLEQSDFENPVGDTLSKFDYTCAADGMRTIVLDDVLNNDAPATLDRYNKGYEYDNLNRLTDESSFENGTSNGYDTVYTYDLVGNRKTRTITVSADGQSDYEHATAYNYDADTDRLLSESYTYQVVTAQGKLDLKHYYPVYHAGSGPAAGAEGDKPKVVWKRVPLKLWSYALVSSFLMLPVLLLLPMLWDILRRLLRRASLRRCRHICALRRGLLYLLMFTMLMSPWNLQILADQAQLHSHLQARAEAIWGQHNRTIEYQYDDNGSMVKKITWEGAIGTGTKLEEVTYDYNLRNRMWKVTTGDLSGTVAVVEYTYNDNGIRVAAYSYDFDGQTRSGETTKLYVIDAYNHTGYAQVLEEWTQGQSTPDVTYTIGADVITESSSSVQHLLYDGHGSVRQHADSTGALNVYQYDTGGAQGTVDYTGFDYDAYGVALTPLPSDGLYYTGEQYDSSLSQYYLRARYYNPDNGRFNRTDDFAGNMQDPQSLHKYTYCHANPVNAIDLSGQFGDFNLVAGLMVFATMMILLSANMANAPGPDDLVFSDTGGEMVIDSFFILAGTLVLNFVIAPVVRTSIKCLRGRLRPIRSPGVGRAGSGKWYRVRESMTPRAATYQARITGRAANEVYVVKGVKFDGYKGGRLLDAKGPGYKNFVKGGKYEDWFRGQYRLVDQANRQLVAAGGVPIEWHFAEKEVLAATEALLQKEGIQGIKLVLTPP